MKRILPILILAVSVGFAACDELGDLIPDVDKTISESYSVVIEEDMISALQDTMFVDVKEYDEYKEYEQYVSGYSVNEISYEITDYDAPDDLYFGGSIMAVDSAGSSTITIGSIPHSNLKDIATLKEKKEFSIVQDGVDELIMWISDPGKFSVIYDLSYEDSMGNTYMFEEEDYGTGFTITVNLEITIETGLDTGSLTTDS